MSADHDPAKDLALEHAFFADAYDRCDDPWDFETSWYEHRKYALTLGALPQARFRRALEPGCANGALTERLAGRCDQLIAFDVVDSAAERARRRLAGRHGVTVLEATFPMFWPSGTGDLVVWSEVAYYLTPAGAEVALNGLGAWLEPGGTLLAVHYTGETSYPRTGRSIGAWLDDTDFLERQTTIVDPSFELGVWRRADSIVELPHPPGGDGDRTASSSYPSTSTGATVWSRRDAGSWGTCRTIGKTVTMTTRRSLSTARPSTTGTSTICSTWTAMS